MRSVKNKEDYQIVEQLIDDNDIISFDIYDTILLRNVLNPTDLFEIVSLELEKLNKGIENFKKIRINAEKHARFISGNEDITLDSIYNVISNKLGKSLSESIKKIELEVEKKFTVSNPFMKKIYNVARNKGKKILIITDMYLPQEFIEKILLINGYDTWTKVYISGQIGVSKASGKLFEYIKDDLNIESNWLHIGDNKISDYKNAINAGINAFYYRDIRKDVDMKSKYTLQKSIAKSIQINYTQTKLEYDYWNDFSVLNISLMLFGFAIWLAQELENKDNIYFLARDGYIPYYIYEYIAKQNPKLPRAKYIYASRRAYQVCNIENIEKNELIEILIRRNLKFNEKITLDTIIKNIGLKIEDYEEDLNIIGIKDKKLLIKNKNDEDIVKKFLFRIYDDIYIKLKNESNVLKKYLTQCGMDEFKEINIVDVGWRGSTQKAISDILNKKVNGYYFGTCYNVYSDIIERVKGYAFNLDKPFKISNKIITNVMMYEFIFSAPHGSLISFEENEGKINPILKNVEKNEFLYSVSHKINVSILSIMKEYLKYYEELKNITVEDCISDYINFIDSKKYEDLEQFEKLSGVVGIGNTQSIHKYVSSVSIKEYNINKKYILRDAQTNLWKNAIIIRGSESDLKRKHRCCLLKKNNFINRKKIYKAIKNPRKAFKVFWGRVKILF